MRNWIRNWTDRHPFSTLAICLVVLGFITWWEAARIEGAQGTVTQGWGTGLAAGILACLGLSAAWWTTILATRGQPVRQQKMAIPLGLILVVSLSVCGRGTLPPSNSTGGPYVITTGIEVGEITYVATFSAYFLVLVIWMAIRLYRRRRQ
jgi:hypothetical protein